MTTERPGPLRVGQVLEGLLDDVKEPEAGEPAPAVEPLVAAPKPGAGPSLPVAIWERMLAAVDQKFDGDDDGDTRGEG